MNRKPVLFFIAIILFIISMILYSAKGEVVECWVLCQPDSSVNLREKPKKTSFAFSEAEMCDKFYTDGKVKNGYLHLVNVPAETTEGWISNSYIVYDEPYKPLFNERCIISTSRVAARRTIGGKVRIWLHDGDVIKVFAISNEWCVTNQGFVKTQFIDTGSYVRDSLADASEEMTFEPD